MKNDIFINGYALDCALGAGPEEVSRQLFSENPEVSVREHEILKMPFFTMKEYDQRE